MKRKPLSKSPGGTAMMTPMQMVGPLTVSEREIMESLGKMKLTRDSGVYDTVTESGDDKRWRLPAKFPSAIQKIFIQALDAEAARNPHLDTFKTSISVRCIKPHHHGYWKRNQGDAHFDGPEDTGHSSYMAASAPTTIQYMGDRAAEPMKKRVDKVFEDKRKSAEEWYKRYASKTLAASSVLPMRLYHFDEDTLHSIPWDLSPSGDENEEEQKMRFFCRISFYKK